VCASLLGSVTGRLKREWLICALCSLLTLRNAWAIDLLCMLLADLPTLRIFEKFALLFGSLLLKVLHCLYLSKLRHLNKLWAMIYSNITYYKHNAVRSTRSRSHTLFCLQYWQALVCVEFTLRYFSLLKHMEEGKRAKNAWNSNTAIIDFTYMFTELLTNRCKRGYVQMP
jgi:hypothetical protein